MAAPPPPPGFEAIDLEGLSPDEALQIGVDLFNDAHFWHAHEVWESAWTRIRSDARILFQALIQFAAALHHAKNGNSHGFRTLLGRATTTLGRVPVEESRMDTAALSALWEHTHLNASTVEGGPILSSYPRLHIPGSTESEI